MRSRWRLRVIFIGVILVSVPLYCLGGALLIFPRPRTGTPTPNPPQATQTRIAEIQPSITPIGGVTNTPPVPDLNLSPTPITVLVSTPTQDFTLLDATPTSIAVFGTPFPIRTLGGPPTQEGQSPFCADYGGATNESIRVESGTNPAPGANIYCRTVTDNNQIGSAEVINRGVLVAVDVFALASGGSTVKTFSQPLKICLRGIGPFLFLDTNQTPKTPQQMNVTYEAGYTCARIPNPGLVVLTSR